ncbi:ATP-binding cassette domain-containing protein [Micromonospora craniellae]|uniref:ABC transporter ATP-binding protein n=1 Tax=Micromonospora craniellae TaxID=2294034 RepID=A0A372G4W8_9ACTN|nr:ABC transporter ATP-binding protein [Micromonospora craniellae]QOC93038.1 ABC transporter ATP-binding protein [Micromonospora craniellae]RFS47816.1 ABC transporter ATP-binding protein [Micromonospora craniellae]
MRLLRDLWATSPRRVTLVVVLIVLGGAGQAAAAALAGPVLVNRSVGFFVVLSAALVVVVVTDLVVSLVMARVTADWAADLRRRLCRVAMGQPVPALETTPVGEMLDRIDGDVYDVSSGVRGPGVNLTQSLVGGLLATVVAITVWWPAGLGMLLICLLLAVTLRRPANRIGPARMHEEEAWSDLAAVMEESVHGQDDVRTSLARPYVLRLYAGRAAEVLRRGWRVWRLSAQVNLVAAGVTRVGVALVVLGGVWALTTGRVDAARLTAIWLLALSLGMTVEHISRMVPEVQYAFGAWGRVRLLQDAPQEPAGGATPLDGDLVVRELTFHYPAAGADRPPALREVDLTFVRGRSYALVGRTGSGKSTLAKVLTRAVDVPSGTVFLGGRDVRDLDIELLRRWIAVVPQRTEILAGTLAENVTLFDSELRDAATRALDELGLTGWVAELPAGMDTRLGEGGHVLSAGQEQLVAFARVLVRDPHVVILDEATARLDPVTEARVQQATERLLRGRIGIVIAHRLSSVRQCDEVVVLADGAVVEAAPLARSRRFAELLADSEAGGYAAGGFAADAGSGLLVASVADRSGDEPALVGAGGATRVGGVPGSAVLPDVLAGADPTRLPFDRASGPTTVVDPAPVVGPEPVAPTDGRKVPTVGTVTTVPTGGTGGADAVGDARPASRGRTLREIFRLCLNDPRYGAVAAGLFAVLAVLGLDGPVLAWLWADVVDGTGDPWLPALGIVAGLLLAVPAHYWSHLWIPVWWVRQMLRISARLVYGQTGPRRVSRHTPAEVVAQGGDTERVVQLADNGLDQVVALILLVTMTLVTGSVVPGLFFLGTMLLSGLTAMALGTHLERTARDTVTARAAFATALVSTLSAARTVKLAGATRPVLTHLADLDEVRSERQRREIAVQVWARSAPSILSGLLPIGVWALFLTGALATGAALVAVSTLAAARWFAWTTASLISQIPSARVWTRRTVDMTGIEAYSERVPGMDLATGTASAPPVTARTPLRRLELAGFGVRHTDGLTAVRDVDLTVERGQLVLIVGPVSSGKSSLLRALAGIAPHTGSMTWNGEPVTEPELFLRPNQVGYVGQLPRVLSGTVADNITLGHPVDPTHALATAQLEHDLAVTGGGLGLLIGHKGTRLSGGQLQRLALARALAPRTELLVADDVSSALDVTTELALWQALRERGVTVIGSTSKRAALVRADHVVVLVDGAVRAQGTWRELAPRWGHLAG